MTLFFKNHYTTICFVSFSYSVFNEHLCVHGTLVGPSGLEPPTSCLSGTRSNLLSYDPIWLVVVFLHLAEGFTFVFLLILPDFLGLVEMMGFEPMTPCLQGRCSPSWATPPLLWAWEFLLCGFLHLFSGSGNGFIRSLSCVSIELSSRTVSRKVFSPLQSLTSVFGMGTGGPSAFVTLTLKNPWSLNIEQHSARNSFRHRELT